MSYNTKFDIIIPCYNVEHIIEKSIESVLSQEYPKDKFSIIVINDGSTDNTLKCLKRFSFEKNLALFSLESNKGLSAARNYGIRKGTSETICFLDSDMVVQPDWLLNIEKTFIKKGIIGVIGEVSLPKEESPNRLDDYFYSKLRGARQFGEHSIIGPTWFLFNNSAVKRSAIEKTNLFDEKIIHYGGEDTDLAIRIWDLFPNSFYYTSQITAEHYHKRTLEKFCSQMETYGKYNLPILLKRYPEHAKQLGVYWINSIRGLLVFNRFIASIIKFLNYYLPNIILTKYLVIYSAIRGYRNR